MTKGRTKKRGLLSERERRFLQNKEDMTYHQKWDFLAKLDSRIKDCIEDVELISKKAQECMKEASKFVLNGFALRTDEKITKYPERFTDERGREFWKKLNIKIDEQIALDGKE